MKETTKKCPMCAELIPLEAEVCEFCAARFIVTRDGYCDTCKEMREADAGGHCKVCGGMVIDLLAHSQFIDEAAPGKTAPPGPAAAVIQPPAAQPAPPAPVIAKMAQPLPAQPAPAETTAFPAVPALPAQKRKSRVWTPVSLGILALCITTGSLLWIFHDKLPFLSDRSTSPTVTSWPTQPVIPLATHKPAATATRPPAATDSRPAWVKNFSQPVLNDIGGHPPNFEDDFSVLEGRFNRWSDLGDGVTFTDGVMRFGLEDAWAQAGGSIGAPNFVLSFSFTLHILGESISFGVDYRIGEKRWYYLAFNPTGEAAGWAGIGLYLNEAWVAEISGVEADLGHAGVTTYITLMVRGGEHAVYVNGKPLFYAQDSRIATDSFCHFWVYSSPGYSEVDIDDVKFWDLDNLVP